MKALTIIISALILLCGCSDYCPESDGAFHLATTDEAEPSGTTELYHAFIIPNESSATRAVWIDPSSPTTYVIDVSEPIAERGVCRHNATYTASIAMEKYPVRIVVGSTGKYTAHAQAQAKIDGEWRWLEKNFFGYEVGDQERVFEDGTRTTFTLIEWIKYNKEFKGQYQSHEKLKEWKIALYRGGKP